MSFERACGLDEVATDQAHKVVLGRYDVAIAKQVHADGSVEVFALQDLCSHAEVALSDGEVNDTEGGATIECFLHGSCFDLRTGKPTSLPATEPVATFPIEVRQDSDGTVAVYVDTDSTLNGVLPA